MQQERGGQQQDRRLKLLQPPENNPPQQPQKCPRCESLNTKFCYYNNYSLSQPRYFCKGCRRYWTQGGTLRNVPVGGGCRKGKRPKKPSPATDNNPQEHDQNTISSKRENDNTITSSSVHPISSGVASSVFYPSGGFLSSLSALQQFNQQPINFMGNRDFMGSNMSLLQGFSLPPLNPNQQLQLQQSQLLQQNRTSSSTNQEWSHQSLINNSSEIVSSDAGYWSNNNDGPGPSMISSQWPDLPGYDASKPHPHIPPSSSPSFL